MKGEECKQEARLRIQSCIQPYALLDESSVTFSQPGSSPTQSLAGD
jgi:hypothetical protein